MIIMANPYCLSIAYARHGENHEYFLVEEVPEGIRACGRDFLLRNFLLDELADLLEISHQIIDVGRAASLVATSHDSIVLDFQLTGALKGLGALPISQSKEPNPCRTLELIAPGADVLQAFASNWDAIFGRRQVIDNLAWKRTLKGLSPNFVVFPGLLADGSLTPKNQRLVPTDKFQYSSSVRGRVSELCRSFLGPKFSNFSRNMIIVSPEVSRINYNHFGALRTQILILLSELGPDTDILVKLHPATENAAEILEAVRNCIGMEILNSDDLSEIEKVKVIPLEFLLLAFNNSHFIGFPSAAISILPRSRIYIVMSGEKKIDSMSRRSTRIYFRLLRKSWANDLLRPS